MVALVFILLSMYRVICGDLSLSFLSQGPSTSKSPSKGTTPSKTATAGIVDDLDGGPSEPDNSFYQFCQLCQRLEKEPSYNAKTKLISDYIKFGTSKG